MKKRNTLAVEAAQPLGVHTGQPGSSPLTGEASTLSPLEEPLQVAPGGDYAQLRRLIKEAGLLDKQPAYYALKIVFTLALLVSGFTFLVLVDNLWLQLLDAVFLALVFGQLGFIGHDAGHRQIFDSTRRNDMVGLAVAFLLGMVRTWWVDKHNRHHSFPNEPGRDPDLDIPVLAFDEDEALGKRGVYRLIVKYQSYLFFPMLCFEGGVGLRLAGVQFMLRRKLKYPAAERMLMAAHFALYFGFLFYLLSPWHAALFIVVHQVLFGLYMGGVFAPNHKGMPILDKDTSMDYLRRQVVTARNIEPHPVTDFCYGGLNYQIEHHLFPDMPRNRLGKARKIVKAYCQDRGISYRETSTLGSQLEILGYFHRTSAPLRGRPR